MSTDRFMNHFKMPKSEIEKVRREYKRAKELAEERKSLPEDSLKNFTEMSVRVFDFFENLTGKLCNREMMNSHLFYWFDEGYEPEEMCAYIAKQSTTEFYRTNPEWFTIAKLFPIKDEDRILVVWDLLSHFQGAKKKNIEVAKGRQFIDPRCGHTRLCSDYEKGCGECLAAGNLNEICRFPYDERVPEELKEFAKQFHRIGEETLLEYQERVGPTMRQIFRDSLKSV